MIGITHSSCSQPLLPMSCRRREPTAIEGPPPAFTAHVAELERLGFRALGDYKLPNLRASSERAPQNTSLVQLRAFIAPDATSQRLTMAQRGLQRRGRGGMDDV